jgi:hypothetical protein
MLSFIAMDVDPIEPGVVLFFFVSQRNPTVVSSGVLQLDDKTRRIC